MTKVREIGIALACTMVVSASAWSGEGPAGHGHGHDETFSAGEPGDAKKPARIVQVTMGEMDGKMMFMPAKLEIKKGEQVKFMLRNNGELEHEFVLASAADNLKHAEAMKKKLAPRKTDEIVWKFSKAGEFEFACLIPGHREAGMVGTVVVK